MVHCVLIFTIQRCSCCYCCSNSNDSRSLQDRRRHKVSRLSLPKAGTQSQWSCNTGRRQNFNFRQKTPKFSEERPSPSSHLVLISLPTLKMKLRRTSFCTDNF